MNYVIKPSHIKFVVSKSRLRFPFLFGFEGDLQGDNYVIHYHDSRRETFTGIHKSYLWRDIFGISNILPQVYREGN